MQWDSDSDLLEACGVSAERLNSGCCGLAGNFGFERGHLDVSRACAEAVLLPAVRSADSETAVLADGFSCRTQITELSDTERVPLHLAELLASGLANAQQELDVAIRPPRPSALARAAAVGATLTSVTLAAGGLAALARRVGKR